MPHRRLAISIVLAAALGTSALVAAASGPSRPAVDPVFASTGAKLYAESQQRGLDQAHNPAYHVKFQPGLREFARATAAGEPIPARVQIDPYLWDYAHDPGNRVSAVSWRNRYGARISGHLWLPPTTYKAPYPTVLLVPGFLTYEGAYWGIAEALQRAGYAVLSFDPQGQGFSDVTPAAEYCHPGAWQQPQEGGIKEQGTCAGEPPPIPGWDHTVPDPPAPLPPVGSLVALHFGEVTPADASPAYEIFRPNFVFGALDAVQWLLSAANERRALIDAKRIAIAGHSAGADGALVTAGVDPKRRFKAAVALDDFGIPPSGWQARVPTMIQQSELQADLGPYLSRPPSGYFPSANTYRRLATAGVPTQLVALRSSSHSDWIYIPESLINPYATPFGNQSRYGERLGAYYAVAWLDRWLKGSATASARLRSCVYDGSADARSIGVGTYNAKTQGNRPYRIKGQRAGTLLSPITASPLDFDGHHTGDLRQACSS